jgi:hypothetical protein
VLDQNEKARVEPENVAPPDPASGSARSRRGNLILAVASALVFLALLEAGARCFYWLRWGRLYPVGARVYAIPLGWRLAPGEYSKLRVNDQGFRRTSPTAVTPPAGITRVFLVGGSTAYGSNGLYPQVAAASLDEDTTIDRHLETLLNERHPGRHFEVINAGVPEYRLFQEFTLFREKLLGYGPELVIFLDGHNDFSTLTNELASSSPIAPYWNNRLFVRAERVLNASDALAPAYFLDLYLGRRSYAYYALATLLQRVADWRAVDAGGGRATGWGTRPFVVGEEAALRAKHAEQLGRIRKRLHFYVDQVRDLRAVAESRLVRVLYVLQPEIVAERGSDLSAQELEIQRIAFAQHRDLGTVAWRQLGPELAAELASLTSEHFGFLDLQRIAARDPDTLYTDYCHLTSKGNAVVAAALADGVEALLSPSTSPPAGP